jgi:hypothetical protein
MIKRKNGLWLLCDEVTGEYLEGSGYYKSLDEARVAEAALPPPAAKPVQTLNRTSEEIKPKSRKK